MIWRCGRVNSECPIIMTRYNAKGKDCRRTCVYVVRGRENGKKEVKFSPKRMPCLPISIIRVMITQ